MRARQRRRHRRRLAANKTRVRRRRAAVRPYVQLRGHLLQRRASRLMLKPFKRNVFRPAANVRTLGTQRRCGLTSNYSDRVLLLLRVS